MKIYTYSTDGTSLFRREKSRQKRGKPVLPDLKAETEEETEEEISFVELLERVAKTREIINEFDRKTERLPAKFREENNAENH